MGTVFISHSHHDREVAGDIKDALEQYGISAFVAHEDIKPSHEWQEAILDNLKHCDAFVALLTDRFEDSEWTDQETGIALATGKPVIPIKIDLDPYGFLSKYQALKWDPDEQDLGLKKLILLLLEKKILTVDNIVEGFSQSYSYANAEFNAELLKTIPAFSQQQMNRIVKATLENSQIWSSFGAKPILRQLFSKYSERIDHGLMKQWKELLAES